MIKLGILLCAVGVVSLFIQHTWYGYVDAAGVLHDSIFLPIGALTLIAAAITFIAAAIRRLLRSKKGRGK